MKLQNMIYRLLKNISSSITYLILNISTIQKVHGIEVPQDVPRGPTVEELIGRVTNTLAMIAGVASIIAIIVGGIKYITSAGNEGRVESAKNTILYAVVGLIISLLAFSIANFIAGAVK